ncbi:hypothetical protein VaNZ11_014766 [Volvox africanus]|uniref:Uncharacterized protein n=1 Tax=Volvox africanus TaxID=51714 RepID=A0ABQ5SJG3_9CHLO|nr:hypothetical protein VaNZ11_014766 [Volvox africanus]
MDFPGCYVYGGRKRKHNQGIDLRSALDAHIRDHLNMTALRTQDKSLMAWTLGDLAFFCYASAVEAQDSRGVPAMQAVHHMNFFEAAQFIASERGILGQTSDDVLKRVSVSMAARFVKSRLPEALESFIAEHGPAPCKLSARSFQAENARSQLATPVAVRQDIASAAAASHGTGSRPSHINPASGSARTSAGPMEPQPVRCGRHATDRVPHGGCQPLFRNYGTQTWDSLLTPSWRLPQEPQMEAEEQGVGAPSPSRSDELQAGAFRRSCGTQTWAYLAAHVARPSPLQEPKPGIQAEEPQEIAPQAATNPMALPATPSQASPAHQAPDPSTQQPTAAADTARVGDNDSGIRDTGIKNTCVNNAGASNADTGRARDWEDACRMRRVPNMTYESTNFDTDTVPNEGEVVINFTASVKCDQQAALQQSLCLPKQTGLRRSPLQQRQGSLPPPLASPRVPSSQQHTQHPPVILCQRPQQWQRQQEQWQHQPLTSHRRHWQQQSSRNRAPKYLPSGPSSGEPRCLGPPMVADKLLPQPNVGGQESNSNTPVAAVEEAAARPAANHEHHLGESEQHWQRQQQQDQGQDHYQEQGQEHHQHRQGYHPWLGQQQSHLQPPQEQQAKQCEAAGIRAQEAQQQQQMQTLSPQRQACGRPDVLDQLRLAGQCEEERVASAAAAAAAALVAGSARSSAGEHRVVQTSFAGAGIAGGAAAAPAAVAATGGLTMAAAAATGHQCMHAAVSGAAATATAADTLREPLLSRLRREYHKRLANAALGNRLRKHLCKKGNSTIRQYCIKEGMPWTLLEVACYGVALQKLVSQPLGVESAIEFLARVKGWRPANDGMDIATIEAAEPRRSYELPSSLVQKVATVMTGAISKYSLMDFIERQHRNKPPPRPPPSQQQQEPRAAAQPTVEACRLEPAAPGDAIPVVDAPLANAAVLPARAVQVAPAAGAWLNVPQLNALLSHANQSPCKTVGTGAVMAAASTTAAPSSYLQQHSRSGGSGSSGAGSPENYATAVPDAVITSGAAAAASLLQEQSGSGVVRRANGKRSPLTPRQRSGARGSGARSRGLEVRLRVHLRKLKIKSLRRCNLSEGVGWTLLDLAEKDRDVRLQMGCEDFHDAEVVRRLLDAKVGPGSQLSQAAIHTVSEGVRRAHRKYQIGDFVTAEIRKHFQRRRKSSTGDAAEVAPAAVPIGAGGGSSAGANSAGS